MVITDMLEQILAQLVQQYGLGIIRDRGKLEALFNDVFSSHRKEMRVLLSVVEQGVVERLIDESISVPSLPLKAEFIKQIHEETAIDQSLLSWGIDAWVRALGSLPILAVPAAQLRAMPGPVETLPAQLQPGQCGGRLRSDR